LRIQAKKRTDTRFFRFEGHLDGLSKQLNQGNQEKQTVKGLLSLIQSSKAISKLNLAIARIHFFTIKELVIFKKTLKKHRSLRSFHFDFDKFWDTGSRPMNHLFMQPQLSNYLSDYHFQIFYQTLKKVSSLRDLSFTFDRYLVSNYALKTLSWEIKKIDLLDIADSHAYMYNDHRKSLEMRILNGTKTDSDGPPNIRILLKDNVRGDPNNMVLKQNTYLWYLEGPKPSQKKGLKLTSEIFESRENIFSRESDLPIQDLRHLNNTLEEKQSFEYLMMEFSNCFFDENEFKNLFLNINKSTCLKRLEIVFPSQEALLEPKLLYWMKCINLPWISFTLGLKEPKTFKQTYLSLSGELVSDTTLQALSSRLKKFSSLESIHIRFNKRDLQRIGQIDEGLLALKKSLMQLFLLQKITFTFSQYNLGQTEIQNLFQGLERLPSLTEINFEFFNCHIIGNWEVELLNENIKKSPSLQIIRFHFFGYKGAIPQRINNLPKNLASVKCDIVYSCLTF